MCCWQPPPWYLSTASPFSTFPGTSVSYFLMSSWVVLQHWLTHHQLFPQSDCTWTQTFSGACQLMLDGITWCVLITVYFVQDLNEFIQGIMLSAALCHLGASVEQEYGPSGNMVTDNYINYLWEPEATAIILYREFLYWQQCIILNFVTCVHLMLLRDREKGWWGG